MPAQQFEPICQINHTSAQSAVFIYDSDQYRGMFKDPVCKMTVDEKTAKHVSEAGGKKIYLCSEACKSQFDANPKKYGY